MRGADIDKSEALSVAGRDLLEVAQIEVGERAKRTADYGTEAGPTLGRYATRTRPGSLDIEYTAQRSSAQLSVSGTGNY